MQVKFVTTWFAPTDVRNPDKIRSISGRRFKPGVHEVPEGLRDFLPASAKIVEEEVKEPDVDEVSIQDLDPERAASDAYVAVQEEAEANRQDAKRKPGRPRKET